jgi:hypothetical protein
MACLLGTLWDLHKLLEAACSLVDGELTMVFNQSQSGGTDDELDAAG